MWQLMGRFIPIPHGHEVRHISRAWVISLLRHDGFLLPGRNHEAIM